MVDNVSRRSFVKNVALTSATTLAAASIASTGITAAQAAESSTFTYADTIKWDAEYDVVVIGIGFAGLSAATTAADNGASVLITEKAKDGVAGGNSRVCAQLFIWGNGDAEATKKYYEQLNGSRTVPDDVVTAYTEGIANLGDTLANTFGMDPSEFKDVADMGYEVMSPEYPEFEGADKVLLYATHEGAFDSYLYQSMRQRLVDSYSDKVDVWFESPAEKLIQDPVSKAIIGVQVDRKGETRNVRAINGVVLCCGGFEANEQMVQDNLNITNYVASGSLENTGDGILMATEVGAKLWHMDAWCGLGGFGGVSYIVDEGVPAQRIHDFDRGPLNTGASILVGNKGGRWVDEAYVPRHGKVPTFNQQWLNPEFPDGIYAIFDEQQMTEINEAGDIPQDYAGQVVECANTEEAAGVIGCEADALQTTIDNYNMFAEQGVDYQFGRDAETMRAFEGDKLYLLPLKANLLNTQGGPERSAKGEVIGIDDEPIPHLYSAGECGGVTSFQYAGGGNVAECFIFGQISGKNAAEVKDNLPVYEPGEPVESTPAHLGDESDLEA